VIFEDEMVLLIKCFALNFSGYKELIPYLSTQEQSLLLSGLIEDVGQVATSTILTVVHSSHEDTSTTLKFVRRYI